VTPHTGLTNGQKVQVSASGFPAGDSLVVVECLANATNENACNLLLARFVQSDATGRVSATLQVTSHVAGKACSSANPCLVSVSELQNPPPHEVDQLISFV